MLGKNEMTGYRNLSDRYAKISGTIGEVSECRSALVPSE